MQLLQRILITFFQCQCQMVVLLISGALGTVGNGVTDRSDQPFKLFTRGGIEPMQSHLPIALRFIPQNTIGKHVKNQRMGITGYDVIGGSKH